MEKTLTISGKEVLFKTNGAIPLRYKAQFGKDYFKDILKMFPLTKLKGRKPKDITVKDLEALDFEVFYNVSWVMAKTADPSIPEPLTWFAGFEEFPIGDVFPELQEMMIATLETSKKKL
jgi:hypothetical protein